MNFTWNQPECLETLWVTLQEQMSNISEICPGGLKGVAAISVVTAFLAQYSLKFMYQRATKAKIRKRVAKTQESIANLRKRLDSLSKEIDKGIIDIPFKDLQRELQSGELTCVQVLLAYQAQALSLHDKLNCVTGFIAEAETRARNLDHIKPSERGPLHGIPISMKEVVGVAGEDCTAGLSHFIDKVHKDYGVMMQVLIKQGAVPFVRTNISQGQISFSCSNPIFGESSNPVDPSRTCGGSSGGEGSLIGGGGSILGIGCDMGGSIRIPSHFCGTCGLKPTKDRMSGAGNLPMGHGIVTIGEIYGPLGRDVDTLVAMMKAAISPDMYRLDPLLPQIPWREELYSSTKPMKIGYYISDGGLEPVPAVKRAVALAKRALEAMGHTVVEFAPGNVVDVVTKYGLGAIFSDNGLMFYNVMKNDLIDPCVAGTLTLFKIPQWIRVCLSKLLFFLHPVERKLLAAKPCGNVYNWWMLNENIEEYRREFLRSMQDQGLDALLCPTFPVTAWHLKDDFHAMTCGTYTMFYNVLDIPSGAVPVTRVTADDVKKMESYPKTNLTEQFIHRGSKGSENLPVTVQGVSFPFKEEVTLRVLKDIEKGLQKLGRPYV